MKETHKTNAYEEFYEAELKYLRQSLIVSAIIALALPVCAILFLF